MNDRTMEAAPVSPWIEAAVVKYGWIWVGITFGFAAKYGLLMKKGKPITVRMVIADALLVGMVALIAFNIITRAGLHGEASALVTSLVAVGADRSIRILIDRFWRQVDAAMPDMGRVKGEMREFDQMRRSHDSLSGASDNEGDDYDGVHFHRLPPTTRSE
jgi:hypothetical protein